MTPYKRLSWSIILALPMVAFGLMIGYFGSIQSGTNAFSTQNSGYLLSTVVTSLNLANFAYAQDNVDRGADIVDVSVGQAIFPGGSLLPAQPIVYSLFITNNSSIPISNIIVSKIVPSEIVSTTVVNTENGSTIVEVSGYPTYSWRIDNLNAETRADIYVLGRLAPDLNESLLIENQLEALHEGDSDASNNLSVIQSEVTVPIISFAAEELSYTEMPTMVNVSLVLEPINPYGTARVDYGTLNGLSASSVGALPDFEMVSGTIYFEAAVQGSNSISVTLFDDYIDEDNEFFQLFLTNPRGATLAENKQVTITIADDDVAGVRFEPPILSLAEGDGEAQYNLSLESQPTASVVVDLNASLQVIASPSSVTFTSSTWDTPQVVNVIAVDDPTAEGLHNGLIGHKVTSLDQKYNSLGNFSVTAGIVDNDRATVSLSTVALTVTEGVNGVDTSATYSISLDTEPTQEVTVSVVVESPLVSEPSMLRFTPDRWDKNQAVTISSIDDSSITESAGPITHRIISEDPAYSKASVDDIALIYLDNDRPGVNLPSRESLKTIEGRTLNYEVSLNAAPENAVTIAVRGDLAQVVIEPPTITFDESNWDQPQPLSITPIDDEMVEGIHRVVIEHDPQSLDRVYDELLSEEVVLRIVDNDVLLYIPYVQRE